MDFMVRAIEAKFTRKDSFNEALSREKYMAELQASALAHQADDIGFQALGINNWSTCIQKSMLGYMADYRLEFLNEMRR